MNKELTLCEEDLLNDAFDDFDRVCLLHLLTKRNDYLGQMRRINNLSMKR